jgi:hypothetical protein
MNQLQNNYWVQANSGNGEFSITPPHPSLGKKKKKKRKRNEYNHQL